MTISDKKVSASERNGVPRNLERIGKGKALAIRKLLISKKTEGRAGGYELERCEGCEGIERCVKSVKN